MMGHLIKPFGTLKSILLQKWSALPPTPQKQGIALNNAAASASMLEWGGSKIWIEKKERAKIPRC